MPNQNNNKIANTSGLSRNTFPPITSPFQNSLLQRILDYQPSPITQAFLTLKKNLELNPSFDDTVQQKHNAVHSVLENLGITDTKLIGSLQRRTRIQLRPGEIFDIDILVPLGEFYGWVSSGGVSPQLALQYLHGILNKSDRYRAMNPQQNQPTITFEYKDDVKVELVPAYLDMVGYSPDGKIHHLLEEGIG
jgi:Second Messenger Oligonucleotide or Dinucleotide Synthetase domain